MLSEPLNSQVKENLGQILNEKIFCIQGLYDIKMHLVD